MSDDETAYTSTDWDGYECDACGQRFRTLSSKRLHDCPAGAEYGGDEPAEEFDVDGMDLDEMAAQATEAALTCEGCGTVADDVRAYDADVGPQGASVAFFFTCDDCGTYNENTATFE